jgi:hypothetical protein
MQVGALHNFRDAVRKVAGMLDPRAGQERGLEVDPVLLRPDLSVQRTLNLSTSQPLIRGLFPSRSLTCGNGDRHQFPHVQDDHWPFWYAMRGADTWSVSAGGMQPIVGRRLGGVNELWTLRPRHFESQGGQFHGNRGGSAGEGRSGSTNGNVTAVFPLIAPIYPAHKGLSSRAKGKSAIGPVPALELHVARARAHRS